jgi:hypothetical protein
LQRPGHAHLKTNAFSNWHASCNEDGMAPIKGRQEGKKTMTSFTNARHTAVSLAAAFVTAMILVASAVGPAAHLTFA